MDENLPHLIMRARDGDKQSFGRLVQQFQSRIFAIAYGIIGRREDAEDITQETFIKAYKAIGNLQTGVAFYRWLVQIAVNTGINYKKSLTTRQSVSFAEINEPLFQGESPEAYVERRESFARLQAMLSELSPEHRVVLVLREIEGLAYDEIADMLQIPLGTVKSRINHARDKLRRIVTFKG
ncbi:MAG TPA: sigma-70 family RNA polymerase sigma factor [Negativicutes bacterium]|nr:sigma-70 family RNA polymerase sigma factor [Negativicutes bacterium]